MTKLRATRGTVAVVLCLGLTGCGGSDRSSPQSPTRAATPAPQAVTAGTTLSVVSGEDYGPVDGATVILHGREYTTDGAGHVVLAEDVPYGGFVGIVATGFLGRQTVVSPDGNTRFVLWPRETANGMSEEFTAQLVYTFGWSEEPEHGTSSLERIPEGMTQVFVWISEEILQDDRAARVHESAIDEMNAALEGRAIYILTATQPTGGVTFEVGLDPGGSCAPNVLGYFSANGNARGEITGGEIGYCGLDAARLSIVVTHELGHSIGLQHTYAWEELMSRYFSRYSINGFSEREALAMRLLFERPAGNRFPDTDREVSAASAGVHTTVCY